MNEQKYKKTQTNLMLALNSYNFEKVNKILSGKNTNVDIQDTYGKTAIMYAIENSTVSKIKNKLNKMKNINTKLLNKLYCSSSYTVSKILEKTNNINIKDIYGRTPLIYTIINCDWLLCKKLLKKGANPNIQDNDGRTALMYTFIYELENKSSKDSFCYLSSSPLIIDALFESLTPEELDKFVNIQDITGKNALMYAIKAQSNSFIFLSEKTNLNVLDKSNKTALIYAIESKNYTIINQILYLTDRSIKHLCYENKKDNVWKLTLQSSIHSRIYKIFNKVSLLIYKNIECRECLDNFIEDLVKLVSQDLLNIMVSQSEINNDKRTQELIKLILNKDLKINYPPKFVYPDISFACLDDKTSWLESSISTKNYTYKDPYSDSDDTETHSLPSSVSTEIITQDEEYFSCDSASSFTDSSEEYFSCNIKLDNIPVEYISNIDKETPTKH